MTLLSDVEHLRSLLAKADLFAGMTLERIPPDLIFATLNRLPRLLDAAERDARRGAPVTLPDGWSCTSCVDDPELGPVWVLERDGATIARIDDYDVIADAVAALRAFADKIERKVP
jgi:hypothetical protein